MTQKTLETMALNISGNIATITLTQEKKLNAMNQAFFNDFSSIVNDFTGDTSIKAMIITGIGNGFSVGADLKQLPVGADLDLERALRENFEPMILGLRKLPFPTIAAVNGHAAGAGMGLMLGCDFTIAAASARFAQAFINIALVPDAGSTYFLPRLIGHARATEMMMLGDSITAEKACRIGLIYKVVEDQLLQKEALQLASRLAAKPTVTLIQIRKLLDQSQHNDLKTQLLCEAAEQKIAGRNENFTEGVNAFLEKREPNFK